MKADVSTPMAASPMWKACLRGVMIPRTMLWSVASTSSTSPRAHMGQVETGAGPGFVPASGPVPGGVTGPAMEGGF